DCEPRRLPEGAGRPARAGGPALSTAGVPPGGFQRVHQSRHPQDDRASARRTRRVRGQRGGAPAGGEV
ncbi:MAG: hypothetical protein AVDCRST_MAG64-1461, partial [uncultured Phycisphaerae bacterium]